MKRFQQLLLGAGMLFASAFAGAISPPAAPDGALKGLDALPKVDFAALDLDRLAQEDMLNDKFTGSPVRFAIARDVDLSPSNSGEWSTDASGNRVWRLRIDAKDAAHLNFGFKHFRVPEGAILHIVSDDGAEVIGPFTHADVLGHGQLWTPVILADSVVLHLSVPPQLEAQVALNLTRVGQGYRGFGTRSKACKSGSCNTDVACLADDDPWNEPRRAVGILTQGGTGFCTGSLVNNTQNDRRMLFATAAHCGVNSNSAAAAVRVYWRYESDVCRTPGSAASGSPTPLSAYSSAGETFLAGTNNPFGGGGAANTRSDWSMIELATPPEENEFDLFWAGWDRRPPPTTCAAPADPSATDGLCASIHHPDGHEKRITFVEVPMTLDDISAAADVHWLANWDPTPPLLANIQPPPASLPPSVTEPGSSGSPLYNADRRLVGVLSGGASFCGVSPGGLNDQYGGLFHSWEGLGTPQTRMRDLLDPTGTGVETIDGLGGCEPPEAPTGVVASANGDNRIDLSWNAVGGIDTYRVLRSDGACPGGGFSEIAEVEAATAYSDLTVSGGNTYSYRIVSVDTEQPCESQQSSCASALAAGACIEPPVFDGLAAATGLDSSTCGIELSWSEATSVCGDSSQLRYNVYRSTSPDLVPDASTLIEDCATATGLVDLAVSSGTEYYYVVRAEDLGVAGGSGQCGGQEDDNLVERSAVPTGPSEVALADDVEGGPANFVADGSGGGANFAIVTTQSNSPTRSWFVPDPDVVSDRRLELADPISATAAGSLEFFHLYDLEGGFDGAVLEYSVDGGATWVDILAGTGGIPANADRLLEGGYDATISDAYDSPISSRAAWSGDSGSFVRTEVDLSDFAGESLLLRFRFASDRSVAATGWWIDDITISSSSQCGLSQIFTDGFEALPPL